jgi:hypothetical protein
VPIRVEADREEQFSVQAAIIKCSVSARRIRRRTRVRETAWSNQSSWQAEWVSGLIYEWYFRPTQSEFNAGYQRKVPEWQSPE